jgi:2-haloacid dehalogenase
MAKVFAMPNSTPSALPAVRAVVFDAYGTLFDVYSVTAKAEQLFNGQGAPLAQLWRDTQIGYTRLYTLSGRYKPFWDITRDALRFSAEKLALNLSAEQENALMQEYACLTPFPENLATLRELKARGLPLGILSNGNTQMLEIAVRSARMEGLFDHVLSVDAVRKFKTAPEAYALGPAAFGVPASEILFVSSNGWDACCSTWYGYRSFWVNRTGQPAERLDVSPTHTGRTLTDLLPLLA